MPLRFILAALLAPLLLSGCIGAFITAFSPHVPGPTPRPLTTDSALFTETRNWSYTMTTVDNGQTRKGGYHIAVTKVEGETVTARLATWFADGRDSNELVVAAKRYAKIPFAPWAPTIASANFEVPEAQTTSTRESVTVPAGTFMADRYEFDVPSLWNCCVDQGHVTMWLAGGLGMVKQVGTLKRGEPDKGEYQVTLELERWPTGY